MNIGIAGCATPALSWPGVVPGIRSSSTLGVDPCSKYAVTLEKQGSAG
jgi:hypothetical protein